MKRVTRMRDTKLSRNKKDLKINKTLDKDQQNTYLK